MLLWNYHCAEDAVRSLHRHLRPNSGQVLKVPLESYEFMMRRLRLFVLMLLKPYDYIKQSNQFVDIADTVSDT